jgi:hypothetical protein
MVNRLAVKKPVAGCTNQELIDGPESTGIVMTDAIQLHRCRVEPVCSCTSSWLLPARLRLMSVLAWMLVVCLMLDAGRSDALGQAAPASPRFGFEFATDLASARETASRDTKILMLIPAAWRSGADSDALSPAVEAFRAGPLVDDAVVRLIQRRFVPYYFELDERGARYDETAAKLAMELCPDLAFPSVMPTPPVILATPEGKLLSTVSVYVSAADFLDSLASAVAQNEPYGELTASEAGLESRTERAQVLHDLRQLDAALEALGDDQSSHAWFLRGAIAQEQERWDEMDAAFKMVTDDNWKNEISVRELYRYWTIRNLDGIRQLAASLAPDHPRHQEAMYYLGLACYHSGDRDEALRVWGDSIQAHPDTAWSLRLDWTRGQAIRGPDAPMLEGPPESLLNRVFLSPHGNPDLKR